MHKLRLRRLYIADILAWADAHHAATGQWPNADSGAVREDRFQTWSSVDRSLRYGLRGLAGGSSLARLLSEQRGVRNIHDLKSLTAEIVLVWADAHHARTGAWPHAESGVIRD